MLTKRYILIKTVLFFLILISFYAIFFHSINKNRVINTPLKDSNFKKNGVHEVKFFDIQTFNKSINKTKNNKSFSYKLKGGIVPHHLLVSDVISDFFSRLTVQNPEIIILLGPNHYEKGNFEVLTSLYSWKTPFGLVYPDFTIINNLIKKNLVMVDEKVLPNDHALSVIMPFIKYYLPNSKVVPLLISRSFSERESSILAEELKHFITDDVIIISSVDFSHYLSNSKAKENDKVTFKVIRDFDYRTLYFLNSEYLDSPASVGILLMVMEKLGSTSSEVLFNSNSGEILNNDYVPTTSYFVMTYY